MSIINDSQKIQILSDLVSINSVNGNEKEVAIYLSNLFKKYGIESKLIEVIPGRSNLIASIGHGKPVLGYAVHLDVVDIVDKSKWNSDPFTLTVKQGKLYGRGSVDMKSGVAAMAISLIELNANNCIQNGTLKFLATIGEEVGEPGSQYFYENGYMDNVDALVIGELSGYQVVHAHKGSMDMRLTSIGKTAHSSMPELGYNAIDPLIDLISNANRTFRSYNKSDAILGSFTFNTTIFNSGTQVNSIPENAIAEINARTIPEFDNLMVEDNMNTLIAKVNSMGANIKLDTYMSLKSINVTPSSSLAKLAQKVGKKYTGNNIPTSSIAPVTDASNLLRGKTDNFPFIAFGPGNETVHQINEYVEKEMYFNFIDIYQDIAKEYLS